MEDSYIGFYALSRTIGDDGYLGALLVTDIYGRPVEFRVTYPVKPSVIQRPLYGDALEPYIGVELCGKEILRVLKHDLDLLVVGDEILLGIRVATEFPVVTMQRSGEVIEVATADGTAAYRSQEVVSPSGRFQPVTVRTLVGYDSDLEKASLLLGDASAHVDPLEPFERIVKALEALAGQEARFR
jgi:hypothetical protein